jgi:hypothetical protein
LVRANRRENVELKKSDQPFEAKVDPNFV